MALAIGDRGSVSVEVTEADSAHTLGNPGVHVLATPRLAELCEDAARDACRRAGVETRGVRVDIRHLAATAVGDWVQIEAVVTEVIGGRLIFEISGRDSRADIVAGRVERIAEAA